MDLRSLPSNYGAHQDTFSPRERHTHRHDVLERIVWTIGTTLIALLAFRFIFALLGANPANGFASFVYGFTAPLVAPFYSLYSYDHPSLGVSVFEGCTLITICVYGLVTAGVTRLVSITRY
jgi:hypothetical protein